MEEEIVVEIFEKIEIKEIVVDIFVVKQEEVDVKLEIMEVDI